MKIKKIIYGIPLHIIFVFLSTNSFAQPFCAQVGGSESDVIFEVHQPSSRGILVAGQTNSFGNGMTDLYCATFANDGTPLWSTAIGYPENEIFGSSIITENSEFVIAGTHLDEESDIIAFRLALNGTPLWRQRVSLSGFNLSTAKVLETSGNNILVVGNQTDGSPVNRTFFALLNGASGTLITSGSINILSSQRVEDAIFTSDNGIAIIATDLNGGGFFLYKIGTPTDFISKLSIRHPLHNRSGDHIPREIFETQEGNFIIVGGKSDIIENFSYGFVITADKLGNALTGVNLEGTTSRTTTKGNMLESIHRIAGTAQFLIAGELDRFKYLGQLDGTPNLVNSRIYGQFDSKLFDVILQSSGNTLVGGSDPGPEGFSVLPGNNGSVMSTLPDLTNCCTVAEVGILVKATCDTQLGFKIIESFINGSAVDDGNLVAGGTRAPICLPTTSRVSTDAPTATQVFKAYPNPADTYVTISANEDLSGNAYQIYSITGKLIVEGAFSENSTRVNTASLKTGTYILKIKGAKQTYTHQLVVTH